MELIIIRHGETIDNENNICQGQTDGCLNRKGELQAFEVRKCLENEEFDIIYSSDLKRAVQTSELIFPNTTIKKDKRLRERYYGNREGKKITNEANLRDEIEGAERLDEMRARVENFINEIKLMKNVQRVAIVSHGVTIRIIISIIENISIFDTNTPTNCSVLRYKNI